MCNPNLKFMAPFVAPPAYFESDGIHLNQDAGSSFIFYIVSSCDELFPATSEQEGIVSPPDGSMVQASIASLSKSVNDLRSDVIRRRLQDNLIFARIK